MQVVQIYILYTSIIFRITQRKCQLYSYRYRFQPQVQVCAKVISVILVHMNTSATCSDLCKGDVSYACNI